MWAIFFKFNVKLLIAHNSRELKGFNKVYMPIATRNFKNIILLIFKDKVASTPCGFFRCAKLFSQKNKVSPPPKARFFAGETFNFWKLSCIYTIFFAGKCFSWSKTPTYFFSCAGKFLNHTFSQKNKLSPLPKARDSRRFFRWIFCTTSTFSVELSTVGKLFLHAFQRYQARYLKRPWCNCPTVFLLRKSRKIAKIARFS